MEETNCKVEESIPNWPYAEKCPIRADFEILIVDPDHPLMNGWPDEFFEKSLPVCEMHGQLATAQWPEITIVDLRPERLARLNEAVDDERES